MSGPGSNRRDGTSTILRGARLICGAVGKYGTTGLASSAAPEFVAAVLALHAACTVFNALDNNPSERDTVEPGVGDDSTPVPDGGV
jgi:hypothetical protein